MKLLKPDYTSNLQLYKQFTMPPLFYQAALADPFTPSPLAHERIRPAGNQSAHSAALPPTDSNRAPSPMRLNSGSTASSPPRSRTSASPLRIPVPASPAASTPGGREREGKSGANLARIKVVVSVETGTRMHDSCIAVEGMALIILYGV